MMHTITCKVCLSTYRMSTLDIEYSSGPVCYCYRPEWVDENEIKVHFKNKDWLTEND